jgi:hypothetical protein
VGQNEKFYSLRLGQGNRKSLIHLLHLFASQRRLMTPLQFQERCPYC